MRFLEPELRVLKRGPNGQGPAGALGQRWLTGGLVKEEVNRPVLFLAYLQGCCVGKYRFLAEWRRQRWLLLLLAALSGVAFPPLLQLRVRGPKSLRWLLPKGG